MCEPNIEEQQNADSFGPEQPRSLGGLGFGAGLSVVGGLANVFKKAYGSEPRAEIRITNKTDYDIEIKLVGGKKENNRAFEKLSSGMTRIFSKKSRDGLGHTTNYECCFLRGFKGVPYTNVARIYVYGKRAPRKDNLIEVRDEGFFLIEPPHEFLVSKWTT